LRGLFSWYPRHLAVFRSFRRNGTAPEAFNVL